VSWLSVLMAKQTNNGAWTDLKSSINRILIILRRSEWQSATEAGGVITCGKTDSVSSDYNDPAYFAQRVNDQFTSWATRTLKVRKTAEEMAQSQILWGNRLRVRLLEAYPTGTVATLVPTPAQGSGFWAWEGDPDCADASLTIMTIRRIPEGTN